MLSRWATEPVLPLVAKMWMVRVIGFFCMSISSDISPLSWELISLLKLQDQGHQAKWKSNFDYTIHIYATQHIYGPVYLQYYLDEITKIMIFLLTVTNDDEDTIAMFTASSAS